MRAARPHFKPAVIELAGLPGAGKTSLVDRLERQCVRRRDISMASLPLTCATWKVAITAFALAFSIRPFRPRLLMRAASLVFMLRAYGANTRWPLVVLDQGLVQKLWSLLVETQDYSSERLDRAVAALVPFLADQLVWVAVPPGLAARRISTRSGGNSRFDNQPAEAIAARLKSLEDTYAMLIAKFDRVARFPVTRIDGASDLDQNAAVIEALAAACLAKSAGQETSPA